MTALVDGWCVVHGDASTPDGRCHVNDCGKLLVNGITTETIERQRRESVARSVGGSMAAPMHQPIVLPATRAARRWMDDTRALVEELTTQRAEATTREMVARGESADLARLVLAFEGLLRQVTLAPTGDKPAPRAQSARQDGRWARGYDACTGCGRTTVKHAARGLCRTCDHTRRYRDRKVAT